MRRMAEAPSLLVVIPCLNEEAHIADLLDRLCADPSAGHARIVVADGGSTDRGADIVRARAVKDARIVLLQNPKRLQSAGVNLAVEQYSAGAEVLIRVDAHAAYPEFFLTHLLDAYRESGADSVTVAMHAVAHAKSCFQRAAACAQNSVLGAGGSPHRKGGRRLWVEHGHHALFKISSFCAIGGYDESFSHNEDAEFDIRLTANGGKILLAADILIDYFPRTKARGLATQYFKFGQGRARTARKHRTPLKLRQLAPIAVAPAILAAMLAPFSLWWALPTAIWLSICGLYGVFLGLRARSPCACGSGLAAAIMHAAWSVGFLAQLTAPRPKRQSPSECSSNLPSDSHMINASVRTDQDNA